MSIDEFPVTAGGLEVFFSLRLQQFTRDDIIIFYFFVIKEGHVIFFSIYSYILWGIGGRGECKCGFCFSTVKHMKTKIWLIDTHCKNFNTTWHTPWLQMTKPRQMRHRIQNWSTDTVIRWSAVTWPCDVLGMMGSVVRCIRCCNDPFKVGNFHLWRSSYKHSVFAVSKFKNIN